MELYLGTIGEPGFPVISIFFTTTTTKLPLFLPLPPHFYCFSTKQVIFQDQTGQAQGKRPNTGQKGEIQAKKAKLRSKSQTQITCLVENIRNEEEEEEKIEVWWWRKTFGAGRCGVDVGSMQGRCVGGKIKIKNIIRGK